MYKAIYYDQLKNKIHLWGDGKHDDAGYNIFDYQKCAYMPDENGEHISIDGTRCRMVETWTPEAVKMGLVYEHDVPPTTRFIIDKYGHTDELSTGNKVLYIDIEVAKEEQYSTPSEAANTITSISWFLTGDKYYTCVLLDTTNSPSETFKQLDIELKDGKYKQIDVKIKTVATEEELLKWFMKQYKSFDHNLISGWNVELFDIPYLYNRIRRILGAYDSFALSPINNCTKKETTLGEVIEIAGIAIFDYLFLYKKFTYVEQPNYRLDTIAKYELGRGKIEYEGDLDSLYKNDIATFALYNIVDVELIVELEEKMQLINTAIGICHVGHIQYDDIVFTSRYIDGAILTYCKRNNLIVSNNKRKSSTDKAKGAFVKQPVPGLYHWVYDLDLTSLYPMNIITLNISPETKYAKIINWDEEEFVRGTSKTYILKLFKDTTAIGKFDDIFDNKENITQLEINGSKELHAFATENNMSIASNGCMYSLDKQGILPAILSKWFAERKQHQAEAEKYRDKGDLSKAALYDLNQLIVKIMLNSVYGVLLLPTFRLYDKDNGEAVTLTGQSVIQWATRSADWYYHNKLKKYNCEYEIEFEDGSIRKLHGFDKLNGKYVYIRLIEQGLLN